IVLRQHLGDRRRQGGLAVIDVSDRPDVDVRLAAVEFFLCHVPNLCLSGLMNREEEMGLLTGIEPVAFRYGRTNVIVRSICPNNICRSRVVLVSPPFDIGIHPDVAAPPPEYSGAHKQTTSKKLEPLTRIELVTSSLPRTRSTN